MRASRDQASGMQARSRASSILRERGDRLCAENEKQDVRIGNRRIGNRNVSSLDEFRVDLGSTAA